jgi:hypothetical protein
MAACACGPLSPAPAVAADTPAVSTPSPPSFQQYSLQNCPLLAVPDQMNPFSKLAWARAAACGACAPTSPHLQWAARNNVFARTSMAPGGLPCM